MKRVLLFFLILPLSLVAQVQLTNSSFSNGSTKGTGGSIMATSVVGGFGFFDDTPISQHVVINEVYGGGGNAGATYTNDYVELYNPTSSNIDLNGWTIQYASAAGTSWSNRVTLVGGISPGGHYLIKLSSNGAIGAALPGSAVTGSINMSQTAGKVALCKSQTLLSGSNPVSPDIVDFVGYGSTANFFETAFAPSPGSSTSISRQPEGNDSNNNSIDFVAGAPSPNNDGYGKSDQAITFNSIDSKTYGDGPFDIIALASSGLPVSVISSDPTVAMVVNNIGSATLTVLKAGNVVITASQSGNGGYNAAPDVPQSLVINKATLQASTDDIMATYGDEIPPLTISYSGFVGSDNISMIDSPPVAVLIAEAAAAPGAAPAAGAAGGSGSGVSPPQFRHAGSNKISISGGADDNYNIVLLSSGTLTVTKAPLVATADNKSKNVGDPNPELTISFFGFKGTENPSYLNYPPAISTIADLNSLVGNYPITLSSTIRNVAIPGMTMDNYDISFVNGTLTVNQATQTITFNPLAQATYGDSPIILTATGGASGNPVTYKSSDATVAVINENTLTIAGAGTVTITASQAGNTNYSAAPDVSQLLTVLNPAPSQQASNISFSNVFSTQMQLAFVPGNGTNHLVVIKAGSAVDFNPVNSTTYAPGDFVNGNKIVSIDNSTSMTLTGLTPSTTYFVKVFEYNNFNNQPQYLTVGAPLASQATLALPNVYVITPANGSINQNVTLNVTSIALTGAATYTIELNDAADFSGISFVKSGSRTQNFSGLIYGKIYFARVKTNLSPDYGKVTSFNTSVPIVQVTAPANGALNQNTKLNVTATSLAGASVYTIELNEAADFTGASIIQSGARSQNFAGLKYDQQYFTRVMTDNYPVFGPSSSFRTAIPNVYVINPVNGAINQNVSLNVTTNAFTGATTYTIELNTAVDFSGTGFVQTGGRTQNFSGLSFNTTYYARVKTDLSPVYGKVTSFNTAPASWFAYVTSPANNAVNINNTTLNITSNVVPYASTYTIQLSEAFDFSAIAFEVSGNSKTLPLSGLKYNTTYYNRVTTDVSTGYGEVRSFTTRTAESISYVVSPANNASNVSYNVNVRSNLVPGASTYTIELNTASDFTGNSMIQSSSSNTIAFNNLQYNTTYYNRVKTDMSPNWGATRSFTTGDPSMFSYIVSPVNLSTNVKWVVNLTSNTVPNASQYTIEANTAADFTGVSIVKIGSRTQGFTLDQHITYYVRVKTDLYSGWGPSRSFSTGDAVSLAYVTSPVDGAAGVPTTVSVVANALPGATNYTIELNTASDYSGTRLVNSGGRAHSFAGLDQNTTYYTRVQSNLAPGLWGPQGSFTTINPAARIEADWVGSDSDATVVSGNSLKVFPNPFADKFSMLVEDLEQIEIDIQLIDLNGVVLKSWKGETNRFIEVKEELAQGLYILKVTRRHEVLVAKMLKL